MNVDCLKYGMCKDNVSSTWIKHIVRKSLEDQFCQNWHTELNNSSRCNIYRIFKSEFCFEKYLLDLHGASRSVYIKFRCRNNKLPIVTGAFHDVQYQDRKCTLCNGDIGDEYHYLFNCTAFTHERHQLLKRYFYMNPSTEKMQHLFLNSKGKVRLNLIKFIKIILDRFSRS